MANQRVDLSALDALSKEVFPFNDEIWILFDRKTPAMDLIESGTAIPFDGRMSSDGKYWVFPVGTDGHANPAVATGEMDGLPAAGRVETTQVQFNSSTHFQRMDITGNAIDGMIGGQYSVQDGLMFQMKQQPMDARKEFNRLIHGDGSGSLGVPTNVSGGNTITVSDTSFLKVGTQFVIKHDTTGALYTGQTSGTALEVSSITNSTTFVATDEDGVAISLTNGAVSNYTMYRYPGRQGGAINGFGIMVHDSNPTNWGSATSYYGNLNRSSNTMWRGYRLSASSGTISVQSHLQPFMDTLRRRSGQFLNQRMGSDNGVTWYAFTGYQNHRTLSNALKADQRTAPNVLTLKGNWPAVEYEGAAIVVDDDATPSAVRFIHPGSTRRFVVKPWFWDDRTGSIWSRITASDGRDADAFKAYMYTRQQFITIRCRTMGEIHTTSATS